MREDGVHVFGDGSTHKGNDIQRFYRYGILVDPELRIYKPWLDQAFVTAFGGRKEMSEYLERRKLPYKMGTEKAYSTDANVLGATHEAKDLERLDTSMRIVAPIMGVAHWKPEVEVKAEEVTVTFEQGPAGRAERPALRLALRALPGGQPDRRPPRPRHERPDREPGHRRQEPRRSTRRPGMALLHLSYERLLSAIHNENTMDLYFTLGRRLGRLLYEGKWYDPEALMLRDALTRWIATAVSGKVTVELRRGDDWTILDTKAVYMSYAPEKLSMERVADPAFTPEDRIGALEMQNLNVGDNRDLLLHHLDSLRRLGAGPGGPSLAALLGAKEE